MRTPGHDICTLAFELPEPVGRNLGSSSLESDRGELPAVSTGVLSPTWPPGQTLPPGPMASSSSCAGKTLTNVDYLSRHGVDGQLFSAFIRAKGPTSAGCAGCNISRHVPPGLGEPEQSAHKSRADLRKNRFIQTIWTAATHLHFTMRYIQRTLAAVVVWVTSIREDAYGYSSLNLDSRETYRGERVFGEKQAGKPGQVLLLSRQHFYRCQHS
ncbi:hypothetical protein HPB50_004855 [Hyalomma asiaticum]|uniref:Uncharacterized protein n=1 Tax=Hyalomma asiaticum TaxID=266040 RepID=A0ACB7SGR4_HYAAI|nr:hypothetical protein HPB50_004855 [Hyalomma asiaticum]